MHHLVERVEPREDVADDGAIAALAGHACADDLQRAADAGQRVFHLVRDHRRHLAEARERRLLAQQILGSLPLGDVVADRHVLIRRP